MITSPADLPGEAREAFEWIAASRGEMIRPFAVLMQRPSLARKVAELGAEIRFSSTLQDAQRELAILATGTTLRCDFQWASHIDLALKMGVRPEAAAALKGNAPLDAFTDDEAILVAFARSLAATTMVDEATFDAAKTLLGTSGVVELSTVIGYYALLACVINACAPGLD